MSADSKQICQYFNTARGCRFGETCKFIHRLKEHPLTEINEDEALKSKPKKGPPLDGSCERLLCHNYVFDNYCRYGHRCRYIHAHSLEEYDRYLQSKKKKLKTVKIYSKNTEEATVKNSEKKILPAEGNKFEDAQKVIKSAGLTRKRLPTQRKICWFYRRGHCKEGDSCKFKHTDVQSDIRNKGRPNNAKKTHPYNQYAEEDKAEVQVVTEEAGTVISSDTGPQETQVALQDGEATIKSCNLSNFSTIPRKFPPKRAVEEFSRSTISDEEANSLRWKEIDFLKKRFPSDKLEIVHENENSSAYLVTFCPSDPDWVSFIFIYNKHLTCSFLPKYLTGPCSGHF